jgi:hypothetical protein
VRSRSARPDADGASLAPYAAAAATELERCLARVDALLSLARPLATPVDLWRAVQPLATLYGAVAAALGGSLAVANGAAQTMVLADGTLVRVLLAEVMDAAIDAGRTIAGTLDCSASAIRFRLDCALARPIAPDVERLVAGSGIRFGAATNETTLLFPALARTGADPNT